MESITLKTPPMIANVITLLSFGHADTEIIAVWIASTADRGDSIPPCAARSATSVPADSRSHADSRRVQSGERAARLMFRTLLLASSSLASCPRFPEL
jgi:hypothetical protein